MKTEVTKPDPTKDQFKVTITCTLEEMKTLSEGVQSSMDERIQKLGTYLMKTVTTLLR